MKRDAYQAIVMSSLPGRTRTQVENLLLAVQNADTVDEHGTWEFGAEFDNKGRGSALNWDLYGVGRDCHSRKTLVVIQVRQWQKTRRHGFANVRKSYFLIGRNEDDTVFAHPVSANVVHAAIRAGRDVVRAVQDWIFGGDYGRMLRQGDVALVPLARRPKGSDIGRDEVVLEQSHKLTATRILQNGAVYAENPTLIHLPGTHPEFKRLRGWYKLVVGRRGRFYNFAAPTVD